LRQKPVDQQVEFLRALVERCVLAIVEYEEHVRIEVATMPQRVVFSVHGAASDVGILLGPNGANADAIRRLMWTACKKTSLRADLDIVMRGRRF
jgi:predicted RNA-binding protein YlqC (UPF0109 family)